MKQKTIVILTALFSTPLETRNGGIYAYQLKEGKDPLMIAEQEYESGTKLKFTNFTSCIGVVAKLGPILTAVHLVMMGNGGRESIPFSPTDVSRVMTVLCPNPNGIWTYAQSRKFAQRTTTDSTAKDFSRLESPIRCIAKSQMFTAA